MLITLIVPETGLNLCKLMLLISSQFNYKSFHEINQSLVLIVVFCVTSSLLTSEIHFGPQTKRTVCEK